MDRQCTFLNDIVTTMKPLIITTEREGVILRQFVRNADEPAFLAAINEDRKHLSRDGNRIAVKYQKDNDVTQEWLRAEVTGELHLGIWDRDVLKGEIHAISGRPEEVEIGLWIRAIAVGSGYAVVAIRALTGYLSLLYARVFAEIHIDNQASIRAFIRSNYSKVEEVEREWGHAIVFEPVK